MANVRIQQLPEDLAPVDTDVVAVDAALGGTTRRVPIPNLADLIRPVASQPEAEAGSNNTKTMTPLRVEQQTDARLAGNTDATALTNTSKLMVPATVRVAVEQAEFTYEDMANPSTLADIIQLTGRTPIMDGAAATDASHHAAINTCIDKVISGGGGIVWLPTLPGDVDYKVGSTINLHKTGVVTSRVKLQGVSEKARIRRLNATGDIFSVGDGTTPVYYVELRNLLLVASIARTSGIDFKLVKANKCVFEDIISDGSFAGIQGEDLNSVHFRRIDINMPNQTDGYGAIVRSDPSGSGRTDIVKFTEVTVQSYNAGSYGLLVEGRVHGLHTDGFYALGTKRGLQLVSSAASTAWADIPSFCDFRKFETDRALDYSATLEKGYRCEFSRAELSNTSGAMDTPYPQGGNDESCLYIGAGMTDLKFIGGRVGNCKQQAVQDYGLGTQFIGTTFSDMSKAGSGAAAAVYLGASARGFNYQACRVEGYSRASYAFQMESGAKNGNIRDTIYKDVVSGFNSGTGTNVTISDQKDDS